MAETGRLYPDVPPSKSADNEGAVGMKTDYLADRLLARKEQILRRQGALARAQPVSFMFVHSDHEFREPLEAGTTEKRRRVYVTFG